MVRIVWGTVQMLLGMGIVLVAFMTQQLWFPDELDLGFRAWVLGTGDRSTILAAGGILVAVAGLLLAGNNLRRIVILRYIGAGALLAGLFVESFRVPTRFYVHFKELQPIPTSISVGLMVGGFALFALGLITLVRAGLGQSTAGLKHR